MAGPEVDPKGTLFGIWETLVFDAFVIPKNKK